MFPLISKDLPLFAYVRDLAENDDIVIRNSDKGGNVVILNKSDYMTEATRQLSDSITYRKLESDPTTLFSKQLQRLLEEAVSLGYLWRHQDPSFQEVEENLHSHPERDCFLDIAHTLDYTDTTWADTGSADTIQADTGSADTIWADTGSADTIQADTGSADTIWADTGSADTIWADTGSADTIWADTGSADTIWADTGSADTIWADTGSADTIWADTGSADTIWADTGSADTIWADTGSADTIWADTGSADTIRANTGSADTIWADTGYVDTFLLAAPCSGRDTSTGSSCQLSLRNPWSEYKYMQDGDIIIGGVFTVNYYVEKIEEKYHNIPEVRCLFPFALYYKHLLTFVFTINEFNKSLKVLPNITLGYLVYDSCGDVSIAVANVLQILSGPGKLIPNFSCMKNSKLAGFIGDFSSATTVPMANLLSVYDYPQISFGATDMRLNDRVRYPFFFRTVPSDHIQYVAIATLLRYFNWTWVGIIVSDDDSGEVELHELKKETNGYGICIEFIINIDREADNNIEAFYKKSKAAFTKSTSQIVIVCGTVTSAFLISLRNMVDLLTNKTLILPGTWAFHNFLLDVSVNLFNASLFFQNYAADIAGLQQFVNKFITENLDDLFIQDFLITFMRCFPNNTEKKREIFYKALYKSPLHPCTGREQLTDINDFYHHGATFQVFIAVFAILHALNNMHMSLTRTYPEKHNVQYEYMHQLRHFLMKLQHTELMGKGLFFNENGETTMPYNLLNWILQDKTSTELNYNYIGQFSASNPEGKKLLLEPSSIKWKTSDNKVPQSQCSETCPPGSRKVVKRGHQPCCYDCAVCSEGEISNVSDSENCLRCPDHEWPNHKRNKCLLKAEEFISYENDIIAVIFSFTSIFLSVITVAILGFFISFRNTPIVKANNRNVSFILLLSIMMSFLCVFLFIGRPVDITCKLRQVSVATTFSVSVSSVLAKSITVLVAFKATKPGNIWQKIMSLQSSLYIVCACSFIQVMICSCWISVSPPFQELNIHTFPGKIIVQCNEGSVFALYVVLGYMGLLSALSFIVAFLVRTLPDNFNEAKYITFSMLLFCSVWVSTIPAYLSTKGKNVVAVEIFAILSSSSGLLGCIFFPKCYIILFKSNLNTKQHLLGNNIK
ncbi:vomeronasal type-2 receptor 26-like [Bombina bombina]|uniref:vomeronasal type-2 receptor 26-like n=1 Tax=Bombina bombina TaxID=8345 RepID=UPI00235A5D03|nr:vomeronasal type-2 receptor 26-like [Bombina bombina]